MSIFVAPPKRNPLAEILVPTFKAFADAHLQQLEQQKELKALQQLGQELGEEDTGPLDVAFKVTQSRLRPDVQKTLLEGYKAQHEQKLKGLEAEKKKAHAYAQGRKLGFSDEEMEEADVQNTSDLNLLYRHKTNKEEKPLTEYQKEYIALQKANKDLRDREFKLKFDTFENMKKKDKIKLSNTFFDQEIKALQNQLSNRTVYTPAEKTKKIQDDIDGLLKKKKAAAQKILNDKSLSLKSDFDIQEAEVEEADEEETILSGLTDEQLDELLDETGGDIAAAKQLALQRFSR